MATKILVRRGVIADLDQETLDEGELGFTTDTLGLYVGSDTATEGYVKINKTDNIEYDGNALTSATDTDNLKEAIQNIDVALKTEQDNIDALQNGTTNITYDPTASGLTATNIKAAIDEIDSDLDAVKGNSALITYSATASGLNASNVQAAIDEVDSNLDSVIAGTTNIGFSDSNLAATNVSGAIAELGADVVTLQGQTADIEWNRVAEINSTSSSVTINSSNLGESFSLDQDYKFVVDAQTNDTDTSGQFSIQLDGDSTSGRHSSVRHMTTMGTSSPAETTGGSDGSSGSQTDTGLTLGTGSGTQGTQTILHSEFIVSPGITFSDGSLADVHPYIVQGSGSVVAVESSTQGSSVLSYTRLSNFTGGYAKTVSDGAARYLTSVVLSNLPDAGLTDDIKIRVYKRER